MLFTSLITLKWTQHYEGNLLNISTSRTLSVTIKYHSTYEAEAGVTSHRAKRLLFAKVLYTSKGTSSFQIQRHLLACGDISSNPGPKRNIAPKFPCRECQKNVRNNQDAIMCAQCGVWSHVKCLGMSFNIFKYYLSHPKKDWTCTLCALPVFSDSFFSDSFFMNSLSEHSFLDDSEIDDEVDIKECIQKLRRKP